MVRMRADDRSRVTAPKPTVGHAAGCDRGRGNRMARSLVSLAHSRPFFGDCGLAYKPSSFPNSVWKRSCGRNSVSAAGRGVCARAPTEQRSCGDKCVPKQSLGTRRRESVAGRVTVFFLVTAPLPPPPSCRAADAHSLRSKPPAYPEVAAAPPPHPL